MFLQWGILMKDSFLECDKMPLSSAILTNIKFPDLSIYKNYYSYSFGSGGGGVDYNKPLNYNRKTTSFDTIFIFELNNFKNEQNVKTYMEWNNLVCFIDIIRKNIYSSTNINSNFKVNINFHTLKLIGCIPIEMTNTIKQEKMFSTINWSADFYQLYEEQIPIINNLLNIQEQKLYI